MDIKFRAYIPNLQWMVKVVRINFDVKTIEVDLTGGNGDLAEYDFDEVELMQYIGLKDKNGKEICEGDIIQYTSDLMTKKVWNCVIERIGATFAVRKSEKSYADGSYLNVLVRDKRCEIIGNKSENPELLYEE